MIPQAPWKIMNVSLDAAPDMIDRPDACRAVLVLLWFKGAYLGRLELSAGEFPLHRREFLKLAVQAVQPALPALVSSGEPYVSAVSLYIAPGFSTEMRAAMTEEMSQRIVRTIDKRTARRSNLTATLAICTANR